MKRIIWFVALLLFCTGNACGEEIAREFISNADLSPIVEFADNYGASNTVQQLMQDSLAKGSNLAETLLKWMKDQLSLPLSKAIGFFMQSLPAMLLLAMLRSTMPGSNSAGAALFMIRLSLAAMFSKFAASTLNEASLFLKAAADFSGIVSPLLISILTAMGMEGSTALVSPAASIAGGLAADLFAGFGLPICKLTLCTALAGNLSGELNLGRLTRLLRKTANWISGLSVALFTALLALQGSIAEGLDGIALRTAKYAVDSASSVIGSGVSDAWESYITGILAAKNTLGFAGITAILTAAAQPMLNCFLGYFLLNISAAVLSIFGEDESVRAAEQIAGVCQMALALCTGALSVVVILLGAVMAVGKNLAG